MIIVGMTKMDFCALTENAGLFGVVGTLLGAFIGGLFSLMGSVWVNNKQQKAAQNIKEKILFTVRFMMSWLIFKIIF